MNGAHDPCLVGLNYLCAATWNDLTGRDSNNIDGPEGGPTKCCAENPDDDVSQNAADRGGWRFHNLESSGQKRSFSGTLRRWKANDFRGRFRGFSERHV